jgi:hypothetical protein
MQFVNANVAKEAGRLHDWRDRLWSRRYRSIVVADDKAAHARLRYILAHGAKEGLLGSPGAWPGPNCIAALTKGALLRGTWFDRSQEFLARQRGETVFPAQFATTYDIKLTPLPCLQHLTQNQRQAELRHVVAEIKANAEAENQEKNRTPMTVEQILAQDPHSKPGSTDRSPAPFVHASDDSTAGVSRGLSRLRRRLPGRGAALATADTEDQGDVSALGLPATVALRRRGLTSTVYATDALAGRAGKGEDCLLAAADTRLGAGLAGICLATCR